MSSTLLLSSHSYETHQSLCLTVEAITEMLLLDVVFSLILVWCILNCYVRKVVSFQSVCARCI